MSRRDHDYHFVNASFFSEVLPQKVVSKMWLTKGVRSKDETVVIMAMRIVLVVLVRTMAIRPDPNVIANVLGSLPDVQSLLTLRNSPHREVVGLMMRAIRVVALLSPKTIKSSKFDYVKLLDGLRPKSGEINDIDDDNEADNNTTEILALLVAMHGAALLNVNETNVEKIADVYLRGESSCRSRELAKVLLGQIISKGLSGTLSETNEKDNDIFADDINKKSELDRGEVLPLNLLINPFTSKLTSFKQSPRCRHKSLGIL